MFLNKLILGILWYHRTAEGAEREAALREKEVTKAQHVLDEKTHALKPHQEQLDEIRKCVTAKDFA